MLPDGGRPWLKGDEFEKRISLGYSSRWYKPRLVSKPGIRQLCS